MFQIRELNIFIFSLFSSKLRSQIASVSKGWFELSIFVSKSLSRCPVLYDTVDVWTRAHKIIKTKIEIQSISSDYHLISRLKLIVPFKYICSNNYLESTALDIIKLLIKKGADDWSDGLYSACKNNYLNIVNLMIEKGAKNWNSAFYGACKGGHLNIVKLMIEKGARGLDNGINHFYFSNHSENASLEIINLIIKKGETIHWDYALRNACFNKYLNVATLLIEQGATVCSFCGWYKNSGNIHYKIV